ncbi:DciA family protein [Dialister sp.]|uniref:DciA family protein n=1 Tax=Dialister sp. TaxID=1955814 RepID=UPI002E7FBEFC|nr:DciA family protein [Dialister sp.]MEE3453891.1 DciA family protein [Dialister sp.]
MEEDKRPEGKRYQVMDTISNVLKMSDTSQKLFNNDQFHFFLFQKRWKDIVGEIMASESWVIGWKGSTLIVSVSNSAFMQQLFMMKGEILARLRQDEVGKYFTDIRFRAGPHKRDHKATTTVDRVNETIREEKVMYSQPLTEGEKEWISNWVQHHVQNEKIRPQFAEMMEEVLKIRKGEKAHGYHPCPICGNLTAPERKICSACEREINRKRKNRVLLILKKNPHYTYQQVRDIFPCDYSLYDEAREILIHRAKEKVFHKFDVDEEKRKLLALLIHKPLKEITIEEARAALDKMPQKWWE